MFFIYTNGFVVNVFPQSGRGESARFFGIERVFDRAAAGFAKLDAGGGATFEDFDAVVGVWIMRSCDIDCKIKPHFIKAIINGWSRQNAYRRVFDAKRFASSA